MDLTSKGFDIMTDASYLKWKRKDSMTGYENIANMCYDCGVRFRRKENKCTNDFWKNKADLKFHTFQLNHWFKYWDSIELEYVFVGCVVDVQLLCVCWKN